MSELSGRSKRPPRILIVSRLSGSEQEVRENIDNARRISKRVISAGGAPFAAHLLYPQFLNDRVQADRDRGMEAGDSWSEVADAALVYTGRGTSPGMSHDIELLRIRGIPTHYVERIDHVVEALAWISAARA